MTRITYDNCNSRLATGDLTFSKKPRLCAA